MRRSWLVWVVFMGLVPALGFAAPTASDDGEDPEKKPSSEETGARPGAEPSPWVQATGGKASKEPARVYRNADLERLYGGEATTPTAAPSAPVPAPPAGVEGQPQDALEQLFAREAARLEHAKQVAAAEQRAEAARQKLVDAEKRLTAVRNPYLARPGAPEEGAEAWDQADGAQRASQSEAMIRAARDEVAEAERALADLRRANP